MPYNKKSATSSGCLILMLLIYAAYNGIEYLIDYPEIQKKEIKEKQDFVNYWQQENIDFLNLFKCKDLTYSQKHLKIDKFYSLRMIGIQDCNISNYSKIDNLINKKIEHYKVNEIKNANVLIILSYVNGKEVGSYQNGSKAIRMNAEICFVEKKTNIIYKKISIEFKGNPEKEIKRKKYALAENITFGEIPENEISKAIEDEVLKK